MAKFILGAALALVLAGCGGGSDAPNPPTGIAGCTPRVVTVDLLGDSTQYGVDSGANNARAIHNPGVELQAQMDTRFGKGAVIVTDRGVPGSTADQAPHSTADVIVANYGINDERVVDINTFLVHMQVIGATLIESPNPVWQFGPTLDMQGQYVSSEKTLGAPVADVFAYVSSLPDWQSHLHDGVHPDDALYVLIVDNVLAPAVAKQVAPLRCGK